MPEWISVKDRLPDKAGRYLCCCNLNWIMVYGFARNLALVDECDFAGISRSGFYGYDSDGYYEQRSVKFWMPLPEPPKEVE